MIIQLHSRKILSNTEQYDRAGRDAVHSLLSGGIVDQKIISDRRIDLLLEKDIELRKLIDSARLLLQETSREVKIRQSEEADQTALRNALEKILESRKRR